MSLKDSAKYILSIDAGTSGVTVMLLDRAARKLSSAYSEIEQLYPQPGWVEHDPDELRRVVFSLMQRACGSVTPAQIAAIGLTNQRETTVLWDRKTGTPVHNAIVWQCRRTQHLCQEIERAGFGPKVHACTGLRLDAYFSATKISWLLSQSPELRKRAENGELAFGTVDSWLLWNLTGGKAHVTDVTNASRTLLFNIDTRQWDEDLLRIFDIPAAILPEVKESACYFGDCIASVLGGQIPIHGVAGDQQAALFGHGCIRPGESKNTYGTGCFLLVNTGHERRDSSAGLLTTLACGPNGEPVYALEGSIFCAGSAVQWLRDGLGIIRKPEETEEMAISVQDTGGVYLVPAFAGLGAPYWNMAARGAIFGLTRGTTKAHLARATLESIAYQVNDLVEITTREVGLNVDVLKVDGGASANQFLMQFQADVLGVPVQVPENIEVTALGAAFLAGISCGLWPNAEVLESLRRVRRTYKPAMPPAKRAMLLDGWRAAVDAVLNQRHHGE
ncbi:MAG TPA: glycerol kinase GlpK [Planctomycetota bacterium]|nr:glycerol kinase GlpK [Planctomycetota bacterium]